MSVDHSDRGHRRQFIQAGLATALTGSGFASRLHSSRGGSQEYWSAHPSAYSVTPVVGDGKWVWTQPPATEGLLEPRDYRLQLGIQMQGTGDAVQIKATTPVPVEFPEQKIQETDVRSKGCQAGVRRVTPEVSQLCLSAPSLSSGQLISASVTMRLTLYKQYMAHEPAKFPSKQPNPNKEARQRYLVDSPGIQTRLSEVRSLSRDLSSGCDHPWQQAEAFSAWVRENIKARIGTYTSVKRALRDRVGDCEERAAVFVALCRAAGIPARLVWIPNHNWAEFLLVDEEGTPHWIPVHTAAYTWFGWTGVHELVIQKGDKVRVPEKRRPQRLTLDWAAWIGARPSIRFWAELEPLPAEFDADPGPGARRKNARGEWELVGSHELDRVLRDGNLMGQVHSASSGR